jgi:hypothetical protein
MFYCKVCSKCGKEIKGYLYAYCYNTGKPANERLCDDCLKPMLPTFNCDLCNREIKYGTNDFAYSMAQYNKFGDMIELEHCHYECDLNRTKPPAKCDQCNECVRNCDFWYQIITSMPVGKRQCHSCFARAYRPFEHKEIEQPVRETVVSTSHETKTKVEESDPFRIYCHKCKSYQRCFFVV